MAYEKDALPVDDFIGEGVVDVDKSAKIDTNQVADAALIPADQVKPEDIGTLSLRYVDGVPQLVVSSGTAIPAGLTVVDAAGNAVAAYTAAPLKTAPTARVADGYITLEISDTIQMRP
ncbi:hypothetical protein [Streptomyces sp. NPDC001903]|uniref:hypothetical protein n=1 Tax=Streptomyces sp. NPDC001903 TaxID=3364622 RepID=UPI003687A148